MQIRQQIRDAKYVAVVTVLLGSLLEAGCAIGSAEPQSDLSSEDPVVAVWLGGFDPKADDTASISNAISQSVEDSMGLLIQISPQQLPEFSEGLHLKDDKIVSRNGVELHFDRLTGVAPAGLIGYNNKYVAELSNSTISEEQTGRGVYVVSGDIITFGGDITVTPYISIPVTGTRAAYIGQTWRVIINGRQDLEFGVDLPARAVELPTMILNREFVDRVNSGLIGTLYSEPDAKVKVGELRTEDSYSCGCYAVDDKGEVQFFHAIKGPNEWTDMVYLRNDNTKIEGWMPVPVLSANTWEIALIISGIIDAQQGRADLVRESFKPAFSDSKLPLRLRSLLHLFVAFAEAKAGGSPQVEIDAALTSNPYSSEAAEYLVMDSLSNFAKAVAGGEKHVAAEILKQLTDYIAEYRENILDVNWLKAVEDKIPKLRELTV